MFYKQLYLLYFAAVLCAAGCSTNHAEPFESRASGDTLWLSHEMNGRLSLAVAHEEPGRTESVLSGRVEFDPASITHVYPLVTGVYRNIFVQQGAHVAKGQVLAEVYSPDVATAISDFQKAASNLTQAQRLLERDKQLFARELNARQDVETSENNLAQSRADYDRSLHALKILGASEKTSSPIFEITAPISGMIVESFAQPGAQVRSDGSSASFTVGSTNSLWIMLDAYSDQVRSLAVGDSITIRASGLEDHPIATTIDFISPVVDPTSFTTKVRCKLPQQDGLLRPAMFVTATAYHTNGLGLYIPASAVFLGSEGKYYVFAKRAQGEYLKHEVGIGRTESNRVEITDGLVDGDTVVADKALFLNDELASDQR